MIAFFNNDYVRVLLLVKFLLWIAPLNLECQNHSLSFSENRGQITDQHFSPRKDILFAGTHGSYSLFLKNSGVSYQFSKVTRTEQQKFAGRSPLDTLREVPSEKIFHRVDITYVGCNENTRLTPGQTTSFNNYYTSAVPGGAQHVREFAEIRYEDLYPGIDLRFYSEGDNYKYDFIVNPFAEWSRIALKVEGGSAKINSGGQLVITTSLGEIIEDAPVVFQAGKRLKAKWRLKKNVVTFSIEGASQYEELLIDPLIRYWGTYVGGNADENASYSCTDRSGNVYLAGETKSTNNIAVTGAHQQVFGGAVAAYGDAFLTKFNSSGQRVWSTYYGGISSDCGTSCATDSAGNVYLYGMTDSSDSLVIATPGAHQQLYAGSNIPGHMSDVFLAKFDSTGKRIWGTYFGGSNWDHGFGCSTDKGGNIYISGTTSSTSGIATGSTHQGQLAGNQDCFLAKFDPSGVLLWGTYFGGTGAAYEIGIDCRVDNNDNVYFCGYSRGNNGISTIGSHQPVFGGLGTSKGDAFLSRFTSDGILKWGTYYGGTGDDWPSTLTVDAAGNIYMVGVTNTSITNVISTAGSHQNFYAGWWDGFLCQFDSLGVRNWGTYYGDAGNEYATSVAADKHGGIYISGYTSSASNSLLATSCAYQFEFGGGIQDAFFAKFTAGGARIWASFYGGSQNDFGNFCCTDPQGNFFLIGNTKSLNAIASLNGDQPVFGGGPSDAFIAKFDGCNGALAVSDIPEDALSICAGDSTQLISAASCSVHWYQNVSSTSPFLISHALNLGQLFKDTIVYAEEFSCGLWSPRTPLHVTVSPLPVLQISSSNPVICFSQSVAITVTGADSYSWSNGLTTSLIHVYPPQTTTYVVTGVDQKGCENDASFVQVVTDCSDLAENAAENEFKIFPVPVISDLMIRRSNDKQVLVQICDPSGVIHFEDHLSSSESVLDLSELEPGIYFLRILEADNTFVTRKFVK